MKRLFLILLCLSLLLVLPACEDSREVELAHRAAEAHRYEMRPETGEGLVWQLTPKSDCFYAVGYDKDCEMLALIFRSNTDRTYVYEEIWQSIYDEFMAADSLGSYYNRNIKGQSPSRRIDDNEDTYFRP